MPDNTPDDLVADTSAALDALVRVHQLAQLLRSGDVDLTADPFTIGGALLTIAAGVQHREIPSPDPRITSTICSCSDPDTDQFVLCCRATQLLAILDDPTCWEAGSGD